MVLSSSDSFEVHHLRKSRVLVPFVHVGWSCSVPEAIILAADLCKIQRFFCPKIKRKECRQNHAIILMYLMSLIKKSQQKKKERFDCLLFVMLLFEMATKERDSKGRKHKEK